MATRDFTLLELGLALGIAAIVGSTAQFFIVRSVGRRLLYRAGRYIGLTPQRLDSARRSLESRGPLAVFIGINVPGARAGGDPGGGPSWPVFPARRTCDDRRQ